MVTNAPFPARLVAPVPPVEGGPELVINDLYLAASEDPQSPDVVVRFKRPFALPNQRYRVAVLVGDPTGERVRASLTATGPGSTPTGIVEVGDGASWKLSGPTQVRHEPSGFVMIRLPLAATPGGGAVWAEITQGQGADPTVVTPYFDRNTFFASSDAGTLAASRFGHVNLPDGSPTREIAALDAGPVLSATEGKVYVKYTDEVPTAMLGQPVTEVVDSVRIAPNFDTGGVVANFIRIDRTNGTAALYDGFAAAPVDKSGDRSWVITGPAKGVGASTLVFDLDRAASLLGMTLGRDTTGLALTRSFVLGDGRVITADGVMATPAWLELAPRPPPVTAAPGPGTTNGSDSTATDRVPLLLGIAGGALLVIILLALLWRARRRRREDRRVAAAMMSRAEAGDRVPWAKDDSYLTAEIDQIDAPLVTATAVAAPGVEESGDRAVIPADDDAADDEAAAATATEGAEPPPAIGRAGTAPWRSSGRGASTPEPQARPAGVVMAGTAVGALVPPPAEPAEPADPAEPAEPAEISEPEGSADTAEEADRIDPAAALAALDLDLGSFRSRFGPAPEDAEPGAGGGEPPG